MFKIIKDQNMERLKILEENNDSGNTNKFAKRGTTVAGKIRYAMNHELLNFNKWCTITQNRSVILNRLVDLLEHGHLPFHINTAFVVSEDGSTKCFTKFTRNSFSKLSKGSTLFLSKHTLSKVLGSDIESEHFSGIVRVNIS